MRGKPVTVLRVLAIAHALIEDPLDDPSKSDHADEISSPDACDIAAEERLKDIGDEI